MSFDTLAPYYRMMEFALAGGLLQRCRVAFLAETANCRSALLLGEGPGRFLEPLLKVNPRAKVTCIERSPRMIEQARRRLDTSGLARVRFEQADVLDWKPPQGTYDLVAANFFLDCFPADQLATVVAKVCASATVDARWLVTDFREPESGWRRWRGLAALALMYGFFRVTTGLAASALTPPDRLLETGGFRLALRRHANFGLVHSDLWRRATA